MGMWKIITANKARPTLDNLDEGVGEVYTKGSDISAPYSTCSRIIKLVDLQILLISSFLHICDDSQSVGQC